MVARTSATKEAIPAQTKPADRDRRIIPESPERQAARALASLNAAEKSRAARQEAAEAKTAAEVKAAARQPAKRSTQHEAPVEVSVEAAVVHMNVDHLQCRDFGHSWRPFSARWIPKFNQYESQLKCLRCSTVRTRFLSRTGAQISSAYDYADGYQIKGLGRLTGVDRDVIRLHSILAVIDKEAG